MRELKPEEDAFGQEMWAYYNGREIFEVVERDDGYIEPSLLGPRAYFSEYGTWAPFVKEAMGFVKGRVLDVGCGAGRHSLYLQKQGFDVLGIDNSPLAIKICRLRGMKQAETMSIEDVDFPPDSFDTIIMMGNNFGLFGSYRKAQRLFKKFYRVTSAEALIVASTRDPYDTDKQIHREYHKRNKDRGRMGGQIRLRIRFDKYIGRWFDYLMVSRSEMKELLSHTKWRVKKFIDSDSAEYMAVIEKRKGD